MEFLLHLAPALQHCQRGSLESGCTYSAAPVGLTLLAKYWVTKGQVPLHHRQNVSVYRKV